MDERSNESYPYLTGMFPNEFHAGFSGMRESLPMLASLDGNLCHPTVNPKQQALIRYFLHPEILADLLRLPEAEGKDRVV